MTQTTLPAGLLVTLAVTLAVVATLAALVARPGPEIRPLRDPVLELDLPPPPGR